MRDAQLKSSTWQGWWVSRTNRQLALALFTLLFVAATLFSLLLVLSLTTPVGGIIALPVVFAGTLLAELNVAISLTILSAAIAALLGTATYFSPKREFQIPKAVVPESYSSKSGSATNPQAAAPHVSAAPTAAAVSASTTDAVAQAIPSDEVLTPTAGAAPV